MDTQSGAMMEAGSIPVYPTNISGMQCKQVARVVWGDEEWFKSNIPDEGNT